MKSLNVPVLFVAFNKPNHTKRVFEAIRKAKPKKLYITVDAARNKEEEKKVNEVKKIISNVDWPCKVKKLFRGDNQGCLNVAYGINWMFETEEKGIILEDDCLPSPDFFRFCSELLEKYKEDSRVMQISGNNFIKRKRDNYSYYFSNYSLIWGWATWKRAWKKCKLNLDLYTHIKKEHRLHDLYPNRRERILRKYLYDRTIQDNQIKKNWGMYWFFTIAVHYGLCINPTVNLVSNIGLDINSNNMKEKLYNYMYRPNEKLDFPLKHPPYMVRDTKADLRYIDWNLKNKIKILFLKKTGLWRILRK